MIENLKEIEKKWASKHHQTFMHRVKAAVDLFEHKKARETALTLLEGALKKLEHEEVEKIIYMNFQKIFS